MGCVSGHSQGLRDSRASGKSSCLGRGLAFQGRLCGRPPSLFTPSINERLHSLLCKSLNVPTALSPGKLGLPWRSTLPGSPLILRCACLRSFPPVFVPPRLPSSELKPQIPDCMLGFCTWGLFNP